MIINRSWKKFFHFSQLQTLDQLAWFVNYGTKLAILLSETENL